MPTEVQLERKQGILMGFVPEAGYGFVSDDEDTYFVHPSECFDTKAAAMKRYVIHGGKWGPVAIEMGLRSGAVITFEPGPPEKKARPRAKKVKVILT